MPKKILLADDSITIQKVVELTFSDGDYEVIAVNNGAKAIQKLSEMRPDIILSDIIMPEKNGYEVCEYVKSHPEYRNIPVILLTGTFEPFDPDRADKAGCDAVVTKPFESQSLIHKVEELVQQSRTNAAEAPSTSAPADLFSESPSFDSPASSDPFEHSSDIFSSAPETQSTTGSEMPFDSPPDAAFGGETRAFPRMSFEEMQQMADAAPQQSEPPTPPTAPQPAMPEPELSPWDEPEESAGETRALPVMSFDDMRRMAETAHAEPAPFEAPPAPAAPEEPETSPWDEQPTAFTSDPPAFSSSMSFDEAPSPAPTPAAASEPEPAWAPEPEMNTDDPFADSSDSASPFAMAETPVAAAETPEEADAPWETAAPAAEESTPAATEPEPLMSAAPATAAASEAAAEAPTGDLTDEQVDRIARRVVQLMSDQVVKNIAWEVIPDLAEIVVKERIRELEAEA